MARYASNADITDTAMTVTEQHLLDADVEVDLVLAEKGIDPALVALPKPALTRLAVAFACKQACVDGAIGENSPLLQKAIRYEADIKRLSGKVSRSALGLVANGSGGLGTITVGRR